MINVTNVPGSAEVFTNERCALQRKSRREVSWPERGSD